MVERVFVKRVKCWKTDILLAERHASRQERGVQICLRFLTSLPRLICGETELLVRNPVDLVVTDQHLRDGTAINVAAEIALEAKCLRDCVQRITGGSNRN